MIFLIVFIGGTLCGLFYRQILDLFEEMLDNSIEDIETDVVTEIKKEDVKL